MRIPSLDGLRALSILLVIVGHLRRTRGFGELDLGIGDYAHLGVVVFFVISGFLITSLLRDEFQARGRISLPAFYTRRILRIFPAAYCYMAVVFVLWRIGLIHLADRDLAHAVTYTVNFLASPANAVVHLWSLSVEEQFYLLWPFAFARLGPRKAAMLAAGVMVAGPCARIADRLFLLGTPYHGLPMFPMVADSLAAGCLLAVWREWLEAREWYRWLFRRGPAIGMVVLTLLIHRYMNRTVGVVAGTSAINVMIAILIHRCVLLPGDRVGRLLNWGPVTGVGVLSYSLYLWQQLFIDRTGTLWINAFPQNVVLAAVAGLASFWILEHPLQALRSRLRSSRAANPLDLLTIRRRPGARNLRGSAHAQVLVERQAVAGGVLAVLVQFARRLPHFARRR